MKHGLAEQLFLVDPTLGVETVHETLVPKSDEDPNPGPSVNLYERSIELESALNDVAEISKLAGYRTMAEQPYGRRRLEQGGKPVDIIAGRATDKQAELARSSRQHFAKAFGLAAMIGSDLVPEEDAKKMAKADYEDFQGRYAGATGRKSRDKTKRALIRQRAKLSR